MCWMLIHFQQFGYLMHFLEDDKHFQVNDPVFKQIKCRFNGFFMMRNKTQQ